ncbi:MAG: IS21 family transposase [Lachnospiraceae bacterium]|nr:IS21 family transposase [Lachnospiraceae bacterium]
MKRMEDWAAVQRIYKQTRSKRETARVLGIARNTVKKLLEMDHEPTYQRKVYPSILDPFKEQIIAWRCAPYDFNGTRIFRELKKRGYGGSIGPVYTFLRRIDEDVGLISSKATVRHESPPGDQAQFDWTEYEVQIGPRIRTVYCFSMILAASRKKAVCFSLKEDSDAIYEAIQELFEDLGGVTLELLIDNPKALVIENNPRSEEEIRYNPKALMLAKHLGTELNACPCYWPRKKGKVERPFNYIEEQLIKGNCFATMEEINRRGKEFVNKWCDEVHGTTGRIPNEHYLLEEKAVLLPLPKDRYMPKQMQERKVSPDSLVSINANKYSVPVKYVGKTVKFRIIYGFRIEIYDLKGSLILRRESECGKHRTVANAEHYEAIAKKVPTSIPQIRRDFTRIFSNGALFLSEAAKKYDQPTHYARKIMELRELYDDDVLDEFIAKAVKRDALDIKSFRAMLKESSGKGRKSAANALPFPDAQAVSVRECSYYEKALQEVSV